MYYFPSKFSLSVAHNQLMIEYSYVYTTKQLTNLLIDNYDIRWYVHLCRDNFIRPISISYNSQWCLAKYHHVILGLVLPLYWLRFSYVPRWKHCTTESKPNIIIIPAWLLLLLFVFLQREKELRLLATKSSIAVVIHTLTCL